MEQSSPATSSGRLVTVLCALYFLSGFSALVYQTAWQRMLGLFGGSDAIAASLVVGSFLLGLGAGSFVGASFVDRLSARGALRAFALCEFGIAAFALASRFVFYDLLFVRWVALAQSSELVLLLAFLALLPPTLLMGMSMPLLSKAIVTRIERASALIGWLYGLNTLGAAVGTLTAGFVVIGTFGYEAAVYFAALVNVVIGVVALMTRPRSVPEASASQPGVPRPGLFNAAPQVWRWSALAMSSGFIIVALEIIWFRVLGLMMRSDAYAFSVVLSVFLAFDGLGIAFGALIIRRMSAPRRWFCLLQGGIALYALLSIIVLSYLNSSHELHRSFVNAPLLGADASTAAIVSQFSLYFLLTVIVVGPPAFLAGVSFPVIQKAVQDDLRVVGQRVGLIQLANILGNAAGALVTGLVLLQLVGTSGAVRLIALIGLLFVASLFWRRPATRARASGRVPEFAAAAGLAVAIVLCPSNDVMWTSLHGATADTSVLVEEDRTGVAVLRTVGSQGALYIAGHEQSQVPFSQVHGALGILGPLVHPNPESVMVIGSGTGGTPYASGVNPLTKHIRLVEIVSPVFKVMDRFARSSGDASLARLNSDSRIERIVADARHVLFTDDRAYDLIQADAIYPWSSHAGLLYSVEFFRQLRARLKPGGLCVQWVPTARTLATFLEVFPHVTRVNGALIGSESPVQVDLEALSARIHGSERGYLVAGGWNPDLLVQWLRSPPLESWNISTAWRQGREINLDLFPKDEYFLNHTKIDLLRPPASDGPVLTAAPVAGAPGGASGETTITWTTGRYGNGTLFVSRDNGPEALVGTGPSGSTSASWIAHDSTYEFRLYREQPERTRLATLHVRGLNKPVPRLVATPNPVPPGADLGKTTLEWDAGGDSQARVLVSVDSGTPAVLAEGPKGSSTADWIKAGPTYAFRLVQGDTASAPLATVTVSRAPADSAVAAILMRAFAGLLVVAGLAWFGGRLLGRETD